MTDKVFVESFDVLQNGDEWAIAFDIDDEPLMSADFLYAGGNAAVLLRNKKKAYMLVNIFPQIREVLNKLDVIYIFERANGKVSKVYGVNVSHVEKIPYPDDLEEQLETAVRELKEELGDEEFERLIIDLAKEYAKTTQKK